MRSRLLWIPVAGLAFACTEAPLGPDRYERVDGARHAVGQQENAAVYWNDVARSLVMEHASSPFHAARGYALLSIAQYNGAVADDPPRGHGASFRRAAIAAASVGVLSYLYPAKAEALQAMATTFIAETARPGDRQDAMDAGAAAGAAAAAAIIARAQTDGWFVPWSGTVPTGPGYWFSSVNPPAPPAMPLLGQAKPFLLASGNQFRPAPPPAFDSPAFLAALAEVRQFSDERTPQQDSIAKFWALPGGTYTPPGYWNEEAARLAKQYRLADLKAAHLFALMNMAGADALIASHDAKFTYWFIRPSQADPGIQLAVGLPNFPSYASNHAMLSAAMARVIGAYFPAERSRLDRLADEAAMSRLYAGIHYRFDNETGLRTGRSIAAWTLENDVANGEPFMLE